MTRQLLDIVDRLGILVGDEGESASLGPGPTGATDAVDVIVRMPRGVVIEDVADALHIEPARGDIAGDQNIDSAGFEPLQFLDAGSLIDIAMNLAAGEAFALQVLVEFAHRGLAVREHDCGLDMIVTQQPFQRLALLARRDLDLEGGDVLVGGRRAADLDPLGIVHELLRELLDRRRHGRREQHGLALFGKFGADEFDIGDEPHVEHPVGLVDHQQFAAVEQDLAPLEQVHQPARGCDQHVDAIVERLDLVAHLDPADQQRELEIVVLAVFLEILRDLRREFARRGEDQRARHQRAASAAGHDIDHRQDEAGGFAGPGLSDPDDVLHHQDRRNGLGLDIGGHGIARRFHRFEQGRGEAEVGKCHAVSRGPIVERNNWRCVRKCSTSAAPIAGNLAKVKNSPARKGATTILRLLGHSDQLAHPRHFAFRAAAGVQLVAIHA